VNAKQYRSYSASVDTRNGGAILHWSKGAEQHTKKKQQKTSDTFKQASEQEWVANFYTLFVHMGVYSTISSGQRVVLSVNEEKNCIYTCIHHVLQWGDENGNLFNRLSTSNAFIFLLKSSIMGMSVTMSIGK
jgi:hypothetical protein